MEIKSDLFEQITILIPTYNCGTKINRSLKNIINEFNIVIIDDASKDKTTEILKKIQKDNYNKNLEIYYNSINQGVAKNRNLLINKVKTKYFTFLDAGDILNIDKIKYILNKVKEKEEEYDLISFGFFNVSEKEYNEKIKTYDNLDNCAYINNNYKINYIGNGKNFFNKLVKKRKTFDMPCGYIYKLDLFKNNDLKYLDNTVHEDFGLTPIVLIKSKNVFSLNIPGYIYILDDYSITRGNTKEKEIKNAKDILKNADRLINMIEKMKKNREIDICTYKIFRSFLANILVSKIEKLDESYKNEYINHLNKISIEKFYLNDLKGFIKRIKYIIKYKF